MMNLAMVSSVLVLTILKASWPGLSRPSTTGVSRLLLAVLGHAPGADHLDVVVHQAARLRGIAQRDHVGERAVGVEDVPRHLGRERAVMARPRHVLQRDQLHD